MSIAFFSLCGSRSNTVAAQSPPAAVADELSELLKDLKSDQFERRQSATASIVELGPSVLPRLTAAEPSANAEYNQRLKTIINVLEAIDAGQSSKVAQEAWLQFQDAEFETRDLILKKLLALNRYNAHFTLLEQLESDKVRTVFEDNTNYVALLAQLCRTNQWSEIESLLSRDVFWKHQPMVCGRFHLLMGTLDQQIQRMQQRVDRTRKMALEAPPKTTAAGRLLDGEDKELSILIGLLMYQKRYDQAERYINQIQRQDIRHQKSNRLLLNRGDWKTLADRAVLTDTPFDRDKPYFECRPQQYVLLKQYAYGPQAGAKAVQEIEQLETETGVPDTGLITMLHVLNFNWEQAEPNLGLSQNDESLRLLNMVNRPDQMLKLSGAGLTYAARSKWAGEQNEKLQKEVDRLKRFEDKSRTRENAISEVNDTLSYYVAVCDHMLGLGLDEEAILYLRQAYLLVHDIDDLDRITRRIVQTICDPMRPALTFPFLQQAGYSPSQLGAMIGGSSIFGTAARPREFDRKTQIKYLNLKMSESINDPWERLQRIAFLLNSSLKLTDPQAIKTLYPDGFDLDSELAKIEHSSNSQDCWQMSTLYRFHQRSKESQQWKRMAAMRGNAVALFQTAEDALARQEYQLAAKLFDAHFGRSGDYYSLGLSSRAYQLSGRTEVARRRMFHASVIPDYNDSSMENFYDRFTDDQRGAWICDLARLQVCLSAAPTSLLLRNTMLAHKESAPIESSHFGRRRMLAMDTINSVRAFLFVSIFNIESRTQDLMAAIEQRDFELAQSIFEQVESFAPGSPSLVEKSVPRLDELGQTKMADEFTAQTSKFFTNILQKYPNSANHRNNYAWSLACARRKLDHLLRHAQTAVALRPDQAIYLDTLAEAHYARGEFEQAIQHINKAIALEPPHLYYHNQLQKFQKAFDNQRKSRDAIGTGG